MAVVAYAYSMSVRDLFGLEADEFPVKTAASKRKSVRRGRPVNEVW